MHLRAVAATTLAALFLGTAMPGRAQQAAPAAPPAATPGAAPAPAPSTAGGTAAPQARQPSAAQLAQQERMRTCNGTASERSLKANARQTFMTACLAGKSDPQTMMRVCNAQASQDHLTGDARRTYMSTCLKTS